MSLFVLVLVLALLTVVGFRLGRSRAVATVDGRPRALHSLPSYYGVYVALWCGIPALIVLFLWLVLNDTISTALVLDSLPPDIQALPEARLSLVLNDIKNLAQGSMTSGTPDPVMIAAAQRYNDVQATGYASMIVVALSVAILGTAWGRRHIHPEMRARNRVEKTALVFLVIASTLAILTTVGIVLSLLFESMRFFEAVPPMEFLFGTQWSPQIALRADQHGQSGSFGAIPLFAGTFLISLLAMLIAVPVGLMSAIYMSEYAHAKVRATVKPLLEILAGVPTVVYGFFAALTVAPFFSDLGGDIGLPISPESALAAGLVMGIMIIPFVSSLSDDVISSVPRALRDGSYGLGATKSETIKQVILPAALPGVIGAVLLAVSRAIGETMIVVMAAGLAANLTANPFEAVTTVTVQIVTLLVGDQEFDSPKTLAAFALGLVLFCITLMLNVIALNVVKKYREKYD